MIEGTALVLGGVAGKLLYDIAGPAAKELGEMLKDGLRPYRAVRERQLAEKTIKMVQAAGFHPKAVPPRILLTIFDNAGIEDDEAMHTRWAALLANAADPASEDIIPPAFPEILKQISSRDALTLKRIHELSLEKEWPDKDLGSLDELCLHFSEYSTSQVVSSLENLRHQSLIDVLSFHDEKNTANTKSVTEEQHYWLTRFGKMFVRACEPPEKRE